VYRHLPFLVIHVTTDGVVLHCNPETSRVTGYEEGELLGRNLWTLLFPGKLFAQVPRFISLVNPSPLIKDVPMTIRTRRGDERVIAWTRYIYGAGMTEAMSANDPPGEVGGGPRSFICVGVDLTDRLLDAERAQVPSPERTVNNSSDVMAFGPHIGNAGAIDSEIVTPIAISPRAIGAGPCPIEQVRDGLAQVETHMGCVQGAYADGELRTLKVLSESLQQAQTPEGRMAFRLVALENEQQLRGCARALGTIRARVDELLALYRPEIK